MKKRYAIQRGFLALSSVLIAFTLFQFFSVSGLRSRSKISGDKIVFHKAMEKMEKDLVQMEVSVPRYDMSYPTPSRPCAPETTVKKQPKKIKKLTAQQKIELEKAKEAENLRLKQERIADEIKAKQWKAAADKEAAEKLERERKAEHDYQIELLKVKNESLKLYLGLGTSVLSSFLTLGIAIVNRKKTD